MTVRQFCVELFPARQHLYWLIGAVIVGLLVRIPGIFWGSNFPGGWQEHHVDEWTHIVNAERLIRPSLPSRWEPHPYPLGAAVHTAAALLVKRAASGELRAPLPPVSEIVTTGRIISALYGAGTIVVVYLLARRLFRDPRVAVVSAWFMALGGLHVTQSHFFLADVPSLFWLLLGLYFLLLDEGFANRGNSLCLMLAAGSLGVSAGIKLSLFTLVPLGVVALWRGPRVPRVLQAGVFFVFGFLWVNGFTYTIGEILDTLLQETNASYIRLPLATAFSQLVELPAVASLPILALFLYGAIPLARRILRPGGVRRYLFVLAVVVLPYAIYGLLMLTSLSAYPRHLIPFIPWIVVVAAWSLLRIVNALAARRVSAAAVVVPVLLYLAIFVFDGERLFIDEPRNDAAQWLGANVPAGSTVAWFGHGDSALMANYKDLPFPEKGRADVLLMEMHLNNPYTSGQGLRNSYPTDYRYVSMKTDEKSAQRLAMFQALFRGESEYREVARFPEKYFMPEFLLADRLLGNRARNYLAEIVVFRKQPSTAEASQ